MNSSRILIPDGDSSFAGGVIRSLAASPCFRPLVLSPTLWAPVRFSRLCDEFSVPSASEDFLTRVTTWAHEWSADALLPIDEPAIHSTIVCREALPKTLRLPPLPSLEMFETARDKWRFARFLQTRGLSHPPTMSAWAALLDDASLCALAFPVLFKPARSSNGLGIRRFDDLQKLRVYLAQNVAPASDAIIQSFIEGTDIDCSVLCVNGRILAHTIQRPIHSSQSAFRPAGAIQFIDDERVLALATQIVAAMNWSGIAHFDMRLCSRTGRLYVIEMNPRFWGSLLGSLQAGVNFAELTCRLALSLPFPPPQYAHCEYFSGSASLRNLMKVVWGQTADYPLRTALTHIFSDPGPEFVELLVHLARNIRWTNSRQAMRR